MTKQCYDSFQRLKLTSYGGLRHFKSGICQCWICFEDKTLTYCCVAHTQRGAKRQVMLSQSEQLGSTAAGSLKKNMSLSFHTNKRAQILEGCPTLCKLYSLLYCNSKDSLHAQLCFLMFIPCISDLNYLALFPCFLLEKDFYIPVLNEMSVHFLKTESNTLRMS